MVLKSEEDEVSESVVRINAFGTGFAPYLEILHSERELLNMCPGSKFYS